MLSKKIHICHLSSVHHARDTRIFYRYCATLAKYYQVTLIAVCDSPFQQDGIEVIPFKRFKRKGLRILFTWLIMLVKALKTKAKIFHFHDPELIPCGILLHLLGKKVIYDVHENIADDIFDKPWIKNKKLLHFLFNFFEKIAVKKFTVILAEHSYSNRYSKLKTSYHTILNYCDIPFFNSFISTNRNPNYLFYIGIVLENRCILQICEAMYLLQNKGITVEFHCVGELYTDLESKILQLHYYHQIKDHLHFYGRKSLEEGYAISKNAGIGLCLIYPMKNSIDSYPTKMFEYMAVGLPQITSNFPLYQSIVEKHGCGLTVNPLDTNEIAQAVEAMINNKILLINMGENAMNNSQLYNWESQKEILLNIYKQLERYTKV